MRLTDREEAMLAGEIGEPRRQVLTRQVEIDRFFDVEDFAEVAQAYVMAVQRPWARPVPSIWGNLSAIPKRCGGTTSQPPQTRAAAILMSANGSNGTRNSSILITASWKPLRRSIP